MNKRELKQITSPYGAEAVMNAFDLAGKANSEGAWVASAWPHTLDDGTAIIVMDVFLSRKTANGWTKLESKGVAYGEPYYRLFISHQEWDMQYRSSDLKTNWSNACLSSMVWPRLFVSFVDKASLDAMQEFFSSKKSLDALEKFQAKWKATARDRKHEAEKRMIDSVMDTVPALPDDFQSWVRNEPLKNGQYVFYTYSKNRKKQLGRCTECGKTISCPDARHQKNSTCPHCGKSITYIADLKCKVRNDRAQFSIIQDAGKNLVLRWFSGWSKSSSSNREIGIHELARYIIKRYPDPERDICINAYEYAPFKTTGVMRWCFSQGKVILQNGQVYPNNIDSWKKDSAWKYIPLQEIAKRSFIVDPYRLLAATVKHPASEYLIKRGLYSFVAEHFGSSLWGIRYSPVKINEKTPRLDESLLVDKRYIDTLISLDAGEDLVALCQVLSKQQLIYKADELLMIREHFSDHLHLIEDITKYTSPMKLAKYFEKCNGKKAYSDWLDYMRACKDLKLDTKNDMVLFPRDFRKAHDERVVEAQGVLKQALDKKAAARLQAFAKGIRQILSSMPSAYKDYTIMVPKTGFDIRKEGQELHHCVGGYVDRVANGQTMILFVRAVDEPEKSLYTVEFCNGKVLQCRGYRNSVDKPVPAVVQKLCSWFETAYKKQQDEKEKRHENRGTKERSA